ncbi:MAG: GH25 family lysozyme [Acidobacteriota bacterium]
MRTIILAILLAGCVEPATDHASEPLQAAPFFGGDPANGAEFAVDVSVWETPLAQSQMDCFWDSGVRHVVVGTQDALVAHQQLAMAVSRGMTVDAYVYLYWNQDVTAQVTAAYQMVQGYPIGRMWLDIEQPPGSLGSSKLIPAIQQALDACVANGAPCGIYTGPGWWKTYLGNAAAFPAVPLWYALYNHKRSLSDWATEQFGGWPAAAAKQFQTAPLCDVGGADWDVMQVLTTPAIVVDRTPPPPATAPPAAPGNLFPADGMVVPIDYVKLMAGTSPTATSYQLALERYTGTAWATYYTWTAANAYVKVSPPATPALYRVRARAHNGLGWSAWSDDASFDYGNYTGPRPSSSPPPPPAPGGVPASLAPDGTTETGASVAMSCSAVASATAYQFAIELSSGGSWTAYYTYTGAAPSRTFYPQTRGTDYRFRVRAQVAGAYGDWSTYATFHVQ